MFATQNPIEYEGTYPLPEAELDRFLLKVEVGYPSAAEEQAILARFRDGQRPDAVVMRPVIDRAELAACRAEIADGARRRRHPGLRHRGGAPHAQRPAVPDRGQPARGGGPVPGRARGGRPQRARLRGPRRRQA